MTPQLPSPRFRALIVDDEPPARQTLRLLLGREEFDVAGECSHGQEAIDAIARQTPDLLLLDVQMPGMDGFDVLRAIGPSAVPALVFVTAYDRYALKAFETHALDYLLKPFSDERFTEVMARVRDRLLERNLADSGRRLASLLASKAAEAPATIVVKEGSRTVVVPIDDILWIEAEDYYVRLHTRDKRTMARLSLKSLADTLDPGRFVRVHRSTIVNIRQVRTIEPLASGDQRMVLSDGTELRVSRTYRAAVEQRLGRR
jgi:two-component system, LytTR family, response regulator